MNGKVYIYIFIVALVTYVIRALPLTLIRKPIKNRFIRSFLYYVPYVTLAVMTFPSILYSTDSFLSGIAAFVCGLLVAWFTENLFIVAASTCFIVFIIELFL